MLTIIRDAYAKPGQVFTYLGENDEACAPCKLRKTCQNLEVGRRYVVKAVRPVKHDVCTVFEGKVQVVDVEPLPHLMAIPATATRGTGMTNRFDECGAACVHKAACRPAAIAEGAKVRFLEVQGPVPCKVGRDLRFALVERETVAKG
ncbi:MAG TPA: UPF0179 family protein [Candidatus Thermoplasmatota archaeon]|nr:UPF0179 family protein [Candidatus Thermoplasmatota archaeon]